MVCHMLATIASGLAANLGFGERWTTAIIDPKTMLDLRHIYDPVLEDAIIVSSELAMLLNLPLPAAKEDCLYICDQGMNVELAGRYSKISFTVDTFGVDFDAQGLCAHLPPKVLI